MAIKEGNCRDKEGNGGDNGGRMVEIREGERWR